MKNNIFLRALIFILGLFIMSLGVAFSIKADLGVSPISCIPYILSQKFTFSVGQMTIAFNVGLILLQILLLRKNYKLFQLIQFPVVIMFGLFVDYSLELINGIEFTFYFYKLLLCLLSCVLIAFGVFLEVKAKITYLAGEGVAMALTETTRVEFGKTKIATDSSMVIIGVVLSFLFFGQLIGAREGTIIAAILVGFIARFYGKHFTFLNNLIPQDISNINTKEENKYKFTITISREYGSGGHEIGKRVSELLNFKFYDSEIIKLTAEESGYTEEYIKEHEQRITSSLFLELYEDNYAYVNEEKPPLDALFLIQSKMIRDISSRESSVIVGRCGNFILKDNPNSFNIFIHAPASKRKERLENSGLVNKEHLDREIQSIDNQRERYCKHFTGKYWNDVNNYHLTIDSSILGVESSAKLIADTVRSIKKQ